MDNTNQADAEQHDSTPDDQDALDLMTEVRDSLQDFRADTAFRVDTADDMLKEDLLTIGSAALDPHGRMPAGVISAERIEKLQTVLTQLQAQMEQLKRQAADIQARAADMGASSRHIHEYWELERAGRALAEHRDWTDPAGTE